MTDTLRTRIADVAYQHIVDEHGYCSCGANPVAYEAWADHLADAVIRELTDAIPPIVATAIRGYVVAELAAISHHGEVAEYEMLKRLDREALQIARYATTHKDWNG